MTSASPSTTTSPPVAAQRAIALLLEFAAAQTIVTRYPVNVSVSVAQSAETAPSAQSGSLKLTVRTLMRVSSVCAPGAVTPAVEIPRATS